MRCGTPENKTKQTNAKRGGLENEMYLLVHSFVNSVV